MAEILVGQLEADTGEILYPHTMSTVVFTPDGKTVNEQISISSAKIKELESERGYLNSPLINGATDINTVVKNGKYRVDHGNNLNNPFYPESLRIEVTGNNVDYVTQIITSASGKLAIRVKNGTSWTTTVYASTDKVDILFSLASGWVAGSIPISVTQINNVCYISGSLKKQDGSTFTGLQQNILIIQNGRPKKITLLKTSNSYSSIIYGELSSGGGYTINVGSSNISEIRFSDSWIVG